VADRLDPNPPCTFCDVQRFSKFPIRHALVRNQQVTFGSVPSLLGKEPLFGSICATIVQPKMRRFLRTVCGTATKAFDPEAQLYKAVTDNVREGFNRAYALANEKRAGTAGFALTILQRRLQAIEVGVVS